MCLVAFQKNFRKIFSGVWKRRRKTQIQKNTSHNPEKNHQRRQIQSDDRAVDRDPRLRSTARSRKASIAISDLPLSPTYEILRSTLREIAPSIAISIRCDLAKARSQSTARSRDSEIVINGDWNVCRRDHDQCGLDIAIARALSLSLSHFPKIL